MPRFAGARALLFLSLTPPPRVPVIGFHLKASPAASLISNLIFVAQLLPTNAQGQTVLVKSEMYRKKHFNVSHEASGTQHTRMSKSNMNSYNEHHTVINALKCHVFYVISMLGVKHQQGLMGDCCTLGGRQDE